MNSHRIPSRVERKMIKFERERERKDENEEEENRNSQSSTTLPG